MKRKTEVIAITAIFSVAIIAVGVLLGTKKDQKVAQVIKPKGIAVESIFINKEPFEMEVVASATLDVEPLIINSEVNAEVGKITKEVGHSLSAGEVLFELRSEDLDLQLNIARAESVKASVLLQQEQRRLDYRKQEWNSYYGDMEFPKRIEHSVCESAKKDVEIARIRLELEQNRNIKLHPRFKRDALIMQLLVTEDQRVDRNTPMAKICYLDELRLVFFLDERIASLLSKDDAVEIYRHDSQSQGRIRTIYPQLNSLTRLVKCKASYDILPEHFFIGEFSQVHINIQQEDTSIYKIPRVALRDNDEIYVVRDDVLLILAVEVMHVDRNYAYIQGDELKESEELIVSRVAYPRDNMKVMR